MKPNYKFTIFTPCYNSEKYIHRVYNSLSSQSFKDFEWLVIDDASTDTTLEILKAYKQKSEFDVKIIENKVNQMITKSFNKAFLNAGGELFLPLGHDDEISTDALERLNLIWKAYGSDNVAGIWSMCKDQHGKLVGNPFTKDVFVGNFFEIYMTHIWRKEKFPCMRTDILKQHPFEENELIYIPEGILWARVGAKYKTIFTNEVFRTYYIEPENINALTKRTRKQLSEAMIYQNQIWINELLYHLKGAWFFKIRLYFAYAYYSFLDKKGLFVNLKKINLKRDKAIILLISPLAFSMYLLFNLMGKN